MRHGIIAAGHDKTAAAAEIILKDGGNAFDAAIAAFFASFITEPCMSSPGGGAFANIFTADRKALFLDCFCQTPQKKLPLHQIDFKPMVVNFGETTETFHLGMGSIAVPGVIAGIYYIHRNFASIPLKNLLEPALQLAREGVIINNFQHFDIRVLKAIMTNCQESKAIFYPDGKALAVGKSLKMSGMADYLEFLIASGEREFYEGEFAKQLVKDSIEKGGFIRMKDLKSYQVRTSAPLRFKYKDRTIHTNPLPSIGGTLIGLIMRKLEQRQIHDYSAGSPQHVQALQQITEEVFSIDRTVTNLNKKWGSTSHFNIVDKKGNAINITMSNGEGCGYMVPGTNIMLNNMLGEASLLPNGLHSWTADTRLSSMMSPTIVLDALGQFQTAIGTGGGSRIPSMIAQVLHYLIDFNLPVKAAVDAPRLHNEHNELNLEPGFVGKHRADDRLNIIDWDQKAMFFGGVHSIHRQGELIQASGDDRREGFACIV